MIPAVPQKMACYIPCQSTSFFLFVRAVSSQRSTCCCGSRGCRHYRGLTRTPLVFKVVLRASGSWRLIFHMACFSFLWREEQWDVIMRFSGISYILLTVFSSDPRWTRCSGRGTSACPVSSCERMPCSRQKVFLWEMIRWNTRGWSMCRLGAWRLRSRPHRYGSHRTSSWLLFPLLPRLREPVVCPFECSLHVPWGRPVATRPCGFWTDVVLGIQHFLSNRWVRDRFHFSERHKTDGYVS